MATKSTLKVTPIASLKNYANMTETVELPGWEEDKPFICKLRRCNIRVMITAGKIPNPLLAAAQKLYEGAGSKANPKIEDSFKAMELIVNSALAEPTLDDLKEAGVDLTEEQFSQIYLYSQGGIKALERFREQSRSADTGDDGADVSNKAE